SNPAATAKADSVAVSTQPQRILPAAPLMTAEEQEAAKTFEAAQRELDALPSSDKEGQVKILNAFIEKFPDSIQASRARVEMARLKDPKPAVKHPADKPPPPPVVAETPAPTPATPPVPVAPPSADI